jgi:hypothetical protein
LNGVRLSPKSKADERIVKSSLKMPAMERDRPDERDTTCRWVGWGMG